MKEQRRGGDSREGLKEQEELAEGGGRQTTPTAALSCVFNSISKALNGHSSCTNLTTLTKYLVL